MNTRDHTKLAASALGALTVALGFAATKLTRVCR
jgi:hypothetical protein